MDNEFKRLIQTNPSEFESLVVTDPDLVDEGIDISGLQTKTDTSPFLLGNIPDYSGIQYSTLAPTKYTDLMRLYSQGLPMFDTPQAAAPVTTAPDTGDGGQATNFDPVSTPITTDITSDQIDEFAMPTDTGGITGDPIEMENIASNPYDIPMDIDDPGASIENIIAQNPSGTIDGATDVFNINQTGDPALNPGSVNVGQQPMAAGPFDYLQNDSISTIANPDIFDSYAGVNDPQIGDPGFTGYTPSFDTPEQENTVQNIFGKVGQTVEGALTELGKIPGAIADFTSQTVNVFGKKLNVGKTLASLAINKIAGGPATLIFDILKDILPEQAIQTSIVDELKAEKDYGFNMQAGNLNQDPFGRNPVSGLGDYEQTLKEDILGINQSGFQTAKMREKKKEFAQDYFNKKAEKASGVEVEDGTVLGPGEAPGEVVTLEEQLQEQQDKQDAALTESISGDIGVEGLDDETGRFGGGADKDDSPAPTAPQNPTETASYSNEDSYESAAYDFGADDTPNLGDTDTFNRETGSDNSSGSTKGGCCFIMLESRYGDGTMDKVVRRYRDEKMTPRNRRGYYKMARVLVPLMRKSKVFKWIVAKTFADPLVSYGKWYYGENKHGWIFAPVKTAWLKIFDVVGTDTVFIRENGEEV